MVRSYFNADSFDDLSKPLLMYVLPVLLIAFIGLCIIDFIFKGSKQAKYKELKVSSKNQAHGIIFGKKGAKVLYSPTNSEGHVAIFGGSGLGKTSALLIPTLRSWTGTSLTIDISGDICKNVDIHNKLIYNPEDSNSIPYDIFSYIDGLKYPDDQDQELEQLAFLLIPDDPSARDSTKFFNDEGRKILTGALIAFYHEGFDFIKICEIIVGNSWKKLFTMIDKTRNEKASMYISSFEGTNERNTSGCKQRVDSALKLFATNERVKQTIHRAIKGQNSFTPKTLETKNVFVIIEDSRLELYSPLLTIITAQCMHYFSERSNDSKNTILFNLDEFASLGKLDIIPALRKFRKKHVRIMMLTQSMADIDMIYGETKRMAMMNNFKYKVILGASDTATQKYFADLIGYNDQEKVTYASSQHDATKSVSTERRFIIEPSDLDRLMDKLILLFPGGYVALKKNFYFK